MATKALKVDDVVEAIYGMSDADLRRVSAALREAYGEMQRRARVKFSVNDRVKFKGRWGNTVEGTIAKINLKTIHVHNCTDGQRWRVAPSLLTRV